MKMKMNLPAIIFFLLCAWCAAQAQTFEVYVCDAGNFNAPPWQILKFDENGENGEVFIDEQLSWPQDIVFLDHNNTVIISNLNTGLITQYNAETGAYTGNFATGIAGPTRMKIGPDGLLYVLQWGGDGKVLRYNLDGSLVDTFTDVGVTNSIGLDWDEDGNLYVSSYNGGYVQQFSSTGASVRRFINSNLSGPTNIWFDDEGNMIVVDYNGGAVEKFDASGNYVEVFIPNIRFAEGVSFFPNGNILIGDGQNASVKMYDKDGNFIEDFIPAGSLGLMTPNAVILRDVSVSPVREAPKQVDFIVPAMGVAFNLADNNGAPDIRFFEIYDVKGQLQAKIPYTGNPAFWNAAAFAEGMYLIVARLKDGAAWRQKVIVRK